MGESVKGWIETAVAWIRGFILFFIVLLLLAVMYAPIVFITLMCIELILPRSMKMKGRLGDVAWLLSLVTGLIAFIIAAVSPQEWSAVPLYDYLNQQALEQSLQIYTYMGSGVFLMIGGRSTFNTLGLQGR